MHGNGEICPYKTKHHLRGGLICSRNAVPIQCIVRYYEESSCVGSAVQEPVLLPKQKLRDFVRLFEEYVRVL
jgi:hypothetical protein